MKKRNWIKIQADKPVKLPEKEPAHIFVNDGKGNFMIYTSHQVQGVWFIFDPFTDGFRPFRRQQFVTHYMKLIDFPSSVKCKKG